MVTESAAEHALISAHDKLLVPQLGHGLRLLGWKVHSYGRTRLELENRGVSVLGLKDLIGVEETDLPRQELGERLEEHILHPPEGSPIINFLYMNPKPPEEGRDDGFVRMVRAGIAAGIIVITNRAEVIPALNWLQLGRPEGDINVESLARAADLVVRSYLLTTG